MINFKLRCYNDHEFDSWFRDSQSYDEQNAQGLIACPVCGMCEISKALTAPNIIKSGKQEKVAEDPELKMKTELLKMKDYVTKNFENVGDNFVDEARKIVQGDAEKRGIYGNANLKEAQDLADEGIDIFIMPEVQTDA